MKIFKDKFKEAYLILRNNGRDIVNLFRILLSSGFPEISKKSIKLLDLTLMAKYGILRRTTILQ